MLTLHELRRRAAARFPGQALSLPLLLLSWAEDDAEGELAALLGAGGLTNEGLAEVLRPLANGSGEEDRGLLLRCITGVSGSEARARHLLAALCREPLHRVTCALAAAGLDVAALEAALAGPGDRETVLAGLGIAVDPKASSLLQYGRDLTAEARAGAFEHLCHRPEVEEQVVDVLLRRVKGNPVLTGPAGVGKTAVVEGLAAAVAAGRIPALREARLFEVNLGRLVAGTKYRGEFEARVEEVMQAAVKAAPVILFLDEVHLLCGAGRVENGAMDGANLLKPYLARGEIRVIGATTHAEYHRYLAADPALARRFQEVQVEEPAGEALHSILSHQARALEVHHGVSLGEDTVRRAAELAERYLPHRCQPDKTLDLLDGAAVAVRRHGGTSVGPADLLETVASLAGVPAGDDRQRLRELPRALKARVVGQDDAVDRVASVLVQRRLGFANPERPLGVFLFVGDTGVGKTELARALAECFYGDPRKLVRIDLGEHSGHLAVHTLLGAPPGLVGHDREGTLVAGLREHPASVLLFDEVEKASVEVHHLLLGLLDTGRITSTKGRTLNARPCVIVLTSNAVTSADLERRTVGFGGPPAAADLRARLAETFPREFLGRLDEIVPFRALGPDELSQILTLRLREAEARLAGQDVRLVYNAERLVRHLLGRLASARGGARDVARLLERELLQPLATALLRGGAGPRDVELGEEFYRSGRLTA